MKLLFYFIVKYAFYNSQPRETFDTEYILSEAEKRVFAEYTELVEQYQSVSKEIKNNLADLNANLIKIKLDNIKLQQDQLLLEQQKIKTKKEFEENRKQSDKHIYNTTIQMYDEIINIYILKNNNKFLKDYYRGIVNSFQDNKISPPVFFQSVNQLVKEIKAFDNKEEEYNMKKNNN